MDEVPTQPSRDIIDRVATHEGKWVFTRYEAPPRGPRKPRKAHWYNEGTDRPVCGERRLTSRYPLIEGVPKPEWNMVEQEGNKHDGSGDDQYRNMCSSCLSIINDGVDLRAEHARRERDLYRS